MLGAKPLIRAFALAALLAGAPGAAMAAAEGPIFAEPVERADLELPITSVPILDGGQADPSRLDALIPVAGDPARAVAPDVRRRVETVIEDQLLAGDGPRVAIRRGPGLLIAGQRRASLIHLGSDQVRPDVFLEEPDGLLAYLSHSLGRGDFRYGRGFKQGSLSAIFDGLRQSKPVFDGGQFLLSQAEESLERNVSAAFQGVKAVARSIREDPDAFRRGRLSQRQAWGKKRREVAIDAPMPIMAPYVRFFRAYAERLRFSIGPALYGVNLEKRVAAVLDRIIADADRVLERDVPEADLGLLAFRFAVGMSVLERFAYGPQAGPGQYYPPRLPTPAEDFWPAIAGTPRALVDWVDPREYFGDAPNFLKEPQAWRELMARDPKMIFLPAFSQFSWRTMNRLWLRRIFPIAIELHDQTQNPAVTFFHDVDHALEWLATPRDQDLSERRRLNLEKRFLEALETAKEGYTDSELRQEFDGMVHYCVFRWIHEENGPFGVRMRYWEPSFRTFHSEISGGWSLGAIERGIDWYNRFFNTEGRRQRRK